MIAASIASRSGESSIEVSTLASPLFGFAPASASAYSVKTPAKNARTAWPKMIGSETFIIVAFMCREKRTPCSLASAICSARNASSARAPHDRARRRSRPPAPGSTPSGRSAAPSAATNSIRSVVVVRRPSPTARSSGSRRRTSSRRATWSPSTTRPSSAGARLANAFTDAGARRSELPSRSTGLTAEPFTRSYASRAASLLVRGRRIVRVVRDVVAGLLQLLDHATSAAGSRR